MNINEAQLACAQQQEPGSHPDSKALVNLLEPAMDANKREAVLSHIETCASCSEQLKLLLALQTDTEHFAGRLAGAQKTAQSVRRRWLMPVSVAAAMLVAVGFIFLTAMPTQPPPSVLRGEASEVTPVHQSSLDRSPTTLSWEQSFPQPVSVRLMDAAAYTLWQSEPIGAMQIDLPAELVFEPGTYLWQIESSKGNTLAGPYWFEIR